jgi:hypothetical protein
MKHVNYEVRCLLCGAENGQIFRGKLIRPEHCAPPRRRGGMLRCGHCGGSLYLEPIDFQSPMVLKAELKSLGNEREPAPAPASA